MLIVAASLAIFVYGMVASMLGTINPGLATRFQLDNLQTSYIALAQGIGLVVASVSVGPLLDKRGKKVGLLIGLSAVTVALAILANADGYVAMMFSMALMGLGGGITITAANALGSDVSESRRASVLNFLNVFVGLGGLLTPFIAGNLLAGDAKKVAYSGAALALVALLFQFAVKLPGRTRAAAAPASSQVFKEPLLYGVALTVLLYTACEFAIWNWLPKFLVAEGIPQARALNILALGFALALLLGRVAITPVLIKVPPLAVTTACSIAMAVCTWFVLHSSGARTAGILVFCTGLAMAPVFPTSIALVGNLFKEGTATAIGFTITCGFSGLVLSSPIIGWISGPDPQGLRNGLLLLPVSSIVMSILYLTLRAPISGRAHQLAASQAT
jgi:FHS family L-fucose permease-like MFS transporter